MAKTYTCPICGKEYKSHGWYQKHKKKCRRERERDRRLKIRKERGHLCGLCDNFTGNHDEFDRDDQCMVLPAKYDGREFRVEPDDPCQLTFDAFEPAENPTIGTTHTARLAQ